MTKSKVKALFISILFAAVAVCLSVGLAACGKDDDKDVARYGYGEEGFYYYDGADSLRYMLSLQSGTYMITVNGASAYSGSYSYDEESGTVSFKGDNEFAATLGEGALSLSVEGSGYSFKAYKFFEVTYVDENGVTIATESVLNGQSAEALEIEKDGYWFIDWYADSSNSATYSFDTSIAGDTVIYGWYIEKNTEAVEHTITLDYGDGATEVWDTTNGAIYKTLPESHDGKAIIGWWVSATNKSDELTYKYAVGDVFDADTTLFAVYSGIGSSVTSVGITWDAASAGSNVSIEIKDSDGERVIYESALSSTSGVYTSSAFTELESGVYTVEVTSGNVTDTLVYVVNGLARVSLSSADIVENGSGRVLSFAPVEGADGYVITVTNGERTVTEDLGNKTYYNFSSWEMTKEGITFVVTAYGEGYADSESNAFTYVKILDDVTLNISDDVVSWNRVEGAIEYAVTISDVDGNVIDSFYTSDTSFSLKYYENGTYDITVQPHTDGYYSEAKTYYGYAKDSLAAPQITDVTAYTVSWTEIEGADSYVVLINGKEYAVESGTTLAFGDNLPESSNGKYEISVKAVKNGGSDSPYSDVVVATVEFSSAVSYDRNTVYWNYDIEATSYGISVNGGTETIITEGNSAKVTLTKVGDNTITVTAYNGDTAVGYAETTVYAYSITLDPNGAELVNDTAVNGVIYVAQGDELNLGTAETEHAEFIGWYTQADYTQGQSDEYEGKGSLVEDGSTFTGNGSMYLYAYWSYEYIDVTLIVGMGSMTDDSGASVEELVIPIKYNSTTYELPVPAAYNPEDIFDGWFTGVNGAGERQTTGAGVCSGTPFSGEETTFYAYYLAVLYYTRTTYNGETVYAVSAGSKINEVSGGVVTIPESYNGCNLVINSGAFEKCKTVEVLNIPDTVLYIALTNDGYRSGTGAFVGCSALAEVNVYVTESVAEPMYFSEDGVLFHKLASSEDGDVELVYYPYAKSLDDAETPGTYVIPSVVYNEAEYQSSGIVHSVTTIPTQVFRDRAIESVVIPSTVMYIASQAFHSNYKLTSVVFEEGGDAELTISDTAFKSCTALTSVTLPARYTDFNALAFTDCSALVTVTIEEGGVYTSENGILLSGNGATLVYFPIGRSGDVVVSSLTTGTITVIGDKAFYNNGKITSVTIPASVYEIGESAFEGCKSITSIVFEGTANSPNLTIKERAFYGCILVESLTLPVNLVKLGENAFGNCLSLNTVYFDTASSNVTLDFAENAFGSSNNIITLEFGANVPGIENIIGVFDGGNLQTIKVDSNNTNYYTDAVGALYNGDHTKILYYPRGAAGDYTLDTATTTIPYGVFTDRVNLTSVTIGANVNLIEDYAFDGCYYLEKITVDSSNTSYGSDDNGILYTKAGDGEGNYVLSELILCPYMCEVAEIVIAETVTKIADYAFYYNPYITTVTINATTSFALGEGAFYYCESLETVVLPDCMKYIAPYAFYECELLSSVSIPTGVTVIGSYAFYHCYALTGDLNDSANGVTLPEGLKVIGDRAFDMYSGTALGGLNTLGSIIGGGIGKGDTGSSGSDDSSSDGGFAVTIPASVTYIGDYAFRGCWNSEGASVDIVFASSSDTGSEDPELTIGKYAFAYTQYATAVTIPARVTSIDTYAFYYFGASVGADSDSGSGSGSGGGFGRLFSVKTFADDEEDEETYTPVTFETGSKLTELTASVFEGASNVNSIEIPKSVTSISSKAFYGCTSLETVTFETGSALTSIGDSAFYTAGVKSICIPASVTTIGNSAFYGDGTNLSTSLTFETGSQLTTIGYQAFYKTGVTEVALPASLTSVGYSAFASSTSLTKVSFQGENETSGLEELGYNCFNGCTALTDVELPNALKKTGTDNTSKNDAGIFGGCTALVEITIPASVLAIMADTFNGCTSLTTVNFATGCNLETICDGAFIGCTSLKSFTFPDSSTSITLGSEIFSGCALDTVTLSSSIVSIGEAFIDANVGQISVGTSSLFSVDETGKILCSADGGEIVYIFAELEGDIVIPDDVTVIGDYAFANQSKITSVKIGANVTSIGAYAFYYCTKLARVEIADGSALVGDAIGDYAFYYCSKLSDINLPEGLTYLPEHCFDYCSAMTGIALPDSVEAIGDYAFAHSGLEKIDLNCVETVGDSAFRFDYSLVSVTMTNATTEIGEYAFAVSGIETITLPASLTSITSYAFRNCDSLVSIVIPEGVREIGTEAFTYCTALTEISLPSTLVTLGGAAFSYSGLVKCELPSSIVTMGTGVFTDCTVLESATLPENLTELNSSTFYGCTSLVSVELGKDIMSVGGSAFYNCKSLKDIELGEKVTSIGSSAFYGCESLTKIIIPSGVIKIDTSAFRGCTSLVTCDLPSGLTETGQHAFQECSSLESVVFPEGYKTVSDYCFEDCSSLKSVEFGDGVTTIMREAFKGCSSLETVVIGRNVTGIGQQAFYGCTSLTYAYTGDLVTSIASSLFYGCTSLETVDFGIAVKTIESSAFQNCTNLTSISFGIGLEEIDGSAFSGCTELEPVYIPLTVSYVAASAFSGCSCDIYIDNTYNYVSVYWASSWNGGSGTVYYYSQTEPGFSATFDGYDGNYWHYDEKGEMDAWVFAYETYTIADDGGYVLCPEDGEAVSYLCLANEDGTVTVYEVTECTQATEGYNVTLKNGNSYTVVLTDTEGTLTATVTAVTD